MANSFIVLEMARTGSGSNENWSTILDITNNVNFSFSNAIMYWGRLGSIAWWTVFYVHRNISNFLQLLCSEIIIFFILIEGSRG